MNKTRIRVQTFIRYTELLKQLIARDLKLRYRRSFLGYAWSILNPLLIMLVMVAVFEGMFNRNGSIENYAVYLITGRTMFEFITGSTNDAMRSIIGNGSLIKKVYVPKYIFTLAKVTSAMINCVFSMGALLIVMVFTGAKFTPYFFLFPLIVAQAYVFCCGLGFFLAQGVVFFRDLQHIWRAVTTAWMYATPLFYTIDTLSEEMQFFITNFNPAYYYVTEFRNLIYMGQFPDIKMFVMGWIIAFGTFVIGLLCFKKNQDRFILYI